MNHPGKTSSQCGDELQLLELEDGQPVPVPVCSECIGLAHYREDTTNNTLKKALFKGWFSMSELVIPGYGRLM